MKSEEEMQSNKKMIRIKREFTTSNSQPEKTHQLLQNLIEIRTIFGFDGRANDYSDRLAVPREAE